MTPEEQAHAEALRGLTAPAPLRRRLSWTRVGGVILLAGVVTAAIVGFRRDAAERTTFVTASSFAPYVDVTATPQFGFEDPTQSAAANVVLGFVVQTPGSACQPSWGAAYSLNAASTGMDLDRRIARLRQRGGHVTVSFGGQANSELAVSCKDANALAAGYKNVVDRYSLDAIDLDIESDAASAPDVDTRRATAIAAVQQEEKSAGRSLGVWLTLPVGPKGLTETGQQVLTATLTAGVDVAGVNALTMDYGQPLAAGQTMSDLAESSLTGLETQLHASLSGSGHSLSDDEVWQRIGVTPMIGQNDTASERFDLDDAHRLLDFAQQHRLRLLSMWSLNRDRSCGPNYANVEVVSPNCSGVSQDAGAFTAVFNKFSVSPRPATAIGASSSTSSSGRTTPAALATGADDPANSPYPIWNPSQAYPKGTKIVWHHNVYEAKWYTQGDTPDAPVSNVADTPWTLMGPVLPGEHPSATPTLPSGTYPAWNAATVYVAGDRVLYDGVGYQAKWWTQGDLPGIATQSPSDTPWTPLTS
ncbi:MAG: glycosyl hydrolase family 18 [Actinobacteria bacterium]|nr:glycosyl hydrolase family 18 [Actinomycetota bacterium]